MSGSTSRPDSEHPARQPRGSYAKLICLNCRGRKIKCNLPIGACIEPSQHPQPPERSCTRCQQQGLDCIVDNTVLGRPAQKRRRPEKLKDEGGLTDNRANDGADLDPDVQDFVLSELIDEVREIDVQDTTHARVKPSKREVFESLMDSTHLFSALMARDMSFGNLCFQPIGEVTADVTKLVDEDLAILLDEQ